LLGGNALRKVPLVAFTCYTDPTPKTVNSITTQFTLGLLKISGYELAVSAAGMPPLLIHRVADLVVEEVLVEGLPLGSSRMANYSTRRLQVSPGDTLLLASDGIPEVRNPAGEFLARIIHA
jgi:serine phosphatase RsbU (regulator of sigma subunit)